MSDEHFVIRCRGLPWNTTVQEVADFFKSVDILGNYLSENLTCIVIVFQCYTVRCNNDKVPMFC